MKYEAFISSVYTLMDTIITFPFNLLMCCNGCSDASFGYPGGPILFKNLNFGIDLDSRIASKISSWLNYVSC